MSALAKQPVFDPASGEEIGEEPVQGWSMTQEENRDFSSFTFKTGAILKDLRTGPPEWRFAGVALGFLVKAFFAEGIEQLLWHMTAVEAVLEERRESGQTKLLRSRVGLVLGRTDDERKEIRNQFDELYSLRCDLVHGDAKLGDREIYLGHLGRAREMARRIVLWMLQFLSHIRSNWPASDVGLPSREDILRVLDMSTQSRAKTSGLLIRLPADFPNTSEWQI